MFVSTHRLCVSKVCDPLRQPCFSIVGAWCRARRVGLRETAPFLLHGFALVSVCVASASRTELPSRISAAVVLTNTLPTAKAGVTALRKQEDPGYLVTLIT